METKEYLDYIANEIHRTIVTTVDDEGLPVTAAIDMTDSSEWFDPSKKPVERDSFTFGDVVKKAGGYFITDTCIGRER